jgi:hypothetical protein
MLLLTGWIGDGAAYYVGKNFGRHKAMPNVSPNKVPIVRACSATRDAVVFSNTGAC